ncbi:helix-turn-helix domain-containing protein [Pseudonocardia nematodicida]|uniref:Helix-turn-helix domain-containing protein n=1 Tax=Pseudonocardia nematodicida TaxID=1206997 RepID=A0ABV1KDV0_9PSEU
MAPTPAARTRREQRSVDGRALILEAAVKCLIEEGFGATTTLRIQAAAGVSRGRLLHYFPSREALLVAAAEHLAGERVRLSIESVEHALLDAPHDGDRVTRVVEHMWSTFHEPHFWAAQEMWTAARTNDGLAEALLPGERRLGGVIRSGVDRMFGPELAGHPRYTHVRELLLTGMRGVALTYAFDRRDPRRDPHLAQWVDLARLLLEI